jgi:hypothetical protein
MTSTPVRPAGLGPAVPGPLDVFLAFPSGALTYECEGCARCCRGRGFAELPRHVRASPALERLAPFSGPSSGGDSRVSFLTYADGCRHLDDDGACELHAAHGAAGKPATCRLFPFSRLADLGGLWVALPEGTCPLVPAPDGVASLLSTHGVVLSELAPVLALGAAPETLDPVTPLPPDARRGLEETLRDRLDRTADLETTLAEQAHLQERLVGPVASPPPRPLWLELLRGVGAPLPLSPPDAALLLALTPALRVHLATDLPLPFLPSAVQAFALWLSATVPLRRRDLDGTDLLHLFHVSRPLLRMLAYAAEPVPWDEIAVPPVLEQMRSALGTPSDTPLGEMLLQFFRPDSEGSSSLLMQLGASLPVWVPHRVAARGR